MPTTLTVQGTYGQVTAFINGLDSFPRLFVIQKFVLAFGPASTASVASAGGGATGAQTAGGTGAGSTDVSGSPLWVGGHQTAASAGPYNLQITGSIYYTSTPNALSACSKATAAQTTTK